MLSKFSCSGIASTIEAFVLQKEPDTVCFQSIAITQRLEATNKMCTIIYRRQILL